MFWKVRYPDYEKRRLTESKSSLENSLFNIFRKRSILGRVCSMQPLTATEMKAARLWGSWQQNCVIYIVLLEDMENKESPGSSQLTLRFRGKLGIPGTVQQRQIPWDRGETPERRGKGKAFHWMFEIPGRINICQEELQGLKTTVQACNKSKISTRLHLIYCLLSNHSFLRSY